MKKHFILLLIIITALAGCRKSTYEGYTVSDFSLNTYINITVYSENDVREADDSLLLCHDYENLFSRTITDSQISVLNHTKLLSSPSLPVSDIINKSLYYCELTDGALDITIEPLTSLWNITSGSNIVPDEQCVDDALSGVDYHNVIVDDAGNISLLNNAGIDLGAVAKGYIADKIKEQLIKDNVASAIINLGGNILCIGSRPDGSDYTIGIKRPFDSSGSVMLTLKISDMSVVTSGTYERYFTKDDTIYHHIIDPATGYPADSGLISATIISRDSFTGDCLSTACMVMGLERAISLIDSLDDVYGIFIDNDYNVHYTDGAKNFLK